MTLGTTARSRVRSPATGSVHLCVTGTVYVRSCPPARTVKATHSAGGLRGTPMSVWSSTG